MPRHPPSRIDRRRRSGRDGRTTMTDEPRRRRYSIGVAVDWFFFVFAGLAAVWLAYLSFTETFNVGLVGHRVRDRVLGAAGLSRPAATAPHPDHRVRARLLHRTRAHERRPAGRPGQPRRARRGRPDPRGDARRRVDAGRSGHPRVIVAHHHARRSRAAATAKPRSARCSSSATSRTSRTSRRSTATPPSATTCDSGSRLTGGCCRADRGSTGSRPAPSTPRSASRCSRCR